MTARISASGMPMQSSGLGRPPRPTAVPPAPMSPPALVTRMSIRPHRARIAWAMRLTSASSVTSPQMAIVLPSASLAMSRATCSIDSPSPKERGESERVPCTATDAPNPHNLVAITRPRPRDEPVIHAT